MHRSASAPRVSGDFPVNPSSTSPQQQKQSLTTVTHDSEHHHHNDVDLPTYDPLSHAAKKERSRIRSAENAIHLIPLVLALCAIILWFFSNPVYPKRFKRISCCSMKVMTIDGVNEQLEIKQSMQL